MIATFLLLIWVLAFFVPLYWACPARFPALRLGLVSAASAILLYMLSPIILLGVVLYLAGIMAFSALQRRGTDIAILKRLSWGFFVPLLLMPYLPVEAVVMGVLGSGALTPAGIVGFALLGISYTAIRSFMIVRQALEGKPARLSEQIATLLFFGSFSAGPISNAKPWSAIAPRLTAQMALVATSRLIWGAASFLVLSPAVGNLPLHDWLNLTSGGILAGWVSIWQNFLSIYFNFSGYSHIAIACGLFFGATLPENFNWPLRATSIQEFWQRWHRSLSAFIGTYLFKPLVRNFGKPMPAIFAAFVFAGIWHQANLLYLIWGIGHGTALALNMAWNKRKLSQKCPAALRPVQLFLGWAFTLSYVSMVSAFANSTDIAQAMALIRQLFGIG